MRDMILGLMDPMDKMSAVIAERDAEIARLRAVLKNIARNAVYAGAKTAARWAMQDTPDKET